MALIQEIRTVELRMSSGSVACIMKCLLNYERSGKEEFLEGTYTSKYEKSDTNYGIKKGGGCGGGKVFLRKVVTSDFYVEPFLREKPTVKKTTPPKQTITKKPTPNKPVVKTTPKTTAPRTNTKTTTKPVATILIAETYHSVFLSRRSNSYLVFFISVLHNHQRSIGRNRSKVFGNHHQFIIIFQR